MKKDDGMGKDSTMKQDGSQNGTMRQDGMPQNQNMQK
jgi:hypothetical protein